MSRKRAALSESDRYASVAFGGTYVEYARQDLNLQPLAPESKSDRSQVRTCLKLRQPLPCDCTAACTSEPKTANGPAADPLADFVAGLTAEQRQRLAALLTGAKEGGES